MACRLNIKQQLLMSALVLGLMSESSLGTTCDPSTRRIAGNFAVDLKTMPDTRPGTIGTTAAAAQNKLQFNVVPGCSVRILRVVGDVVSWPVGSAPPGTAVGVLWALQTSAQGGSEQAYPAADGTLLYVQDGTRGEVRRTPVDTTLDVGSLEPDGTLISTMAAWLNTTGLPIVHMECTWTVYFRYEAQVTVVGR